ncbi:MAG: alpha/beta hydrolase [Candidatus Hydrogenedentes bacterium]|nr:alpha/beta hydrolase [Candidatus Hydrogenedentota bacterium]
MLKHFKVLLAAILATPFAHANDADIFDAVEHHFVDNNGVKLHYVTLGQGNPILFVHGFPDVWFSWAHQMNGLKNDYKVAAMDLRAYNKSDQPEGVENYRMELLLGDVTAVIDALGGNVTLVAHDWGGAICWRLAMRSPEKVNKLIMCNLTHPKGYMTVRQNATPEQKANTAYIEAFQAPDAADRFNSTLLATIAGGANNPHHERYKAAFERSYVDGMLNYYRAAWSGLESDTQAEMPQLTMPVLQFHGLKDTAVDKDGLRDTWNWIDTDYTLVTLPQSGHWVQREAADIVTTTMKWWLKARE